MGIDKKFGFGICNEEEKSWVLTKCGFEIKEIKGKEAEK